MNRGLLAAALAAAVCAAAASSAAAATFDRGALAHLPRATGAGAAVTYAGGPVMHSERVHLIFWQPSGLAFDPGYVQQIEMFIERTAAASHSASNIFSLIGQYRDASGPAAYQASDAGAIVDTDPLPTGPGSTCTEPLPPPFGTGPPGWSSCVSDAGIENELQNVITAHRLPAGLRDMYIVLTPNRLGDCFAGGPTDCALGGPASSATPGYCGYHSAFGSPTILYAVVPYNALSGHCQSDNPRPNGSTADPTISTVAHEFAEIATDPLGDGWSDPSGYEIADRCLTSYGPNLGGSTGVTAYDQVIDGGDYYIQELWSNYSHACEASPRPDSVSIHGPLRGVTGRPLAYRASAHDPQGLVVGYRWTFGDGRSSNRRDPTHTYRSANRYTITLRITDSWGNYAFASHLIRVAPRRR
jgi:hypothetical protein